LRGHDLAVRPDPERMDLLCLDISLYMDRILAGPRFNIVFVDSLANLIDSCKFYVVRQDLGLCFSFSIDYHLQKSDFKTS